MALNRFYQDELTYLRELGAEFAAAHPKLTRFLGETSRDPDVERLLEGFAFLTGRVREKLADDLPELTHGLISLLWPHYLRAVPPLTVLEFATDPNAISTRQIVPRGATVRSRPIEGVACQFRTTADVALYPIEIRDLSVQLSRSGSRLRITVAAQEGASFDKMGLSALRLHLAGEPRAAQTLYLFLDRFLERVSVEPADGLPFETAERPRPTGFAAESGLLPYPPNAFLGYRLLQEYFNLPEKFMFFDVPGLEPMARHAESSSFDLVFDFARPLDPGLRLKPGNVRLHCVPAVNLFPHEADPIRFDRRRVEYRVRPAGGDRGRHAVYSVDRVEGLLPASTRRRIYAPFESFDHRADGAAEAFYRVRVRQSMDGRRLDYYLSFVTGDDVAATPPTETISLDLTCYNGDLAPRLEAGQIDQPTGDTPPYVRVRNLFAPTEPVTPPTDGRLYWHLISNMSLNYLSLVDPEPLRLLLSAYDFRIHSDRQAERAARHRLSGIVGVRSGPADRLHRGLAIRGVRTELELRESCFAGEGDMYLFAAVLNEFFALYTSVNSFHELQATGAELNEVYQWPPRLGAQPLI